VQEPPSGPHFAPVHGSALRAVLAPRVTRGSCGAIDSERLGRKEKMDHGNALYDHGPPTKFCRAEMKANNGVWNPITQAWMFAAAADAANALCAL
jgi:hypothetical protein